MKIKYIICAVLALIFTACNKNEITELPQPSNTQRLEFKSKDDVLLAIQALDSGKNCEILNSHPNFVSIVKAKAMAKKAGLYKVGSDSLSIQTAAFDTLVPNKSFAALLNPKGEIALNDTIFKITTNGTYKYPRDKETLFNTLYQADSLMMGTLISENFYEIGNGIYRYDTFKKTEDSNDLIGQSDAIQSVTSQKKVAATSVPEPNFGTFPICSGKRTSIVGSWIDALIGETKSYTQNFNKSLRLKGSFYNYNYGIYAECGVTCETQNKGWFFWGQTPSDEMRIGWKNMIFEVDIPTYPISSVQQIPSVSNPYQEPLPGSTSNYTMMTLFDYNISKNTVMNLAGQTTKTILPALTKYLNSQVKSNAEVTALKIMSSNKVYFIILNEDRKSFQCKSLTHVFAKSYFFEITVGNVLDGLPSGLLGWANALKGSLKGKKAKITSGQVYFCARYDSEWKGNIVNAE